MAKEDGTLKEEERKEVRQKGELEKATEALEEKGLFLGLFFVEKEGKKFLVVSKVPPKSDQERQKEAWACYLENRMLFDNDDMTEKQQQEFRFVFSWQNVTWHKVFLAPSGVSKGIIEPIDFVRHEKWLNVSAECVVVNAFKASEPLP